MGNKPNKTRSRSENDVVGNGLDPQSEQQGLGSRGSKARRSESAKDQKKKNKKTPGGPKGSSSTDDLSTTRDRTKSCPTDPREGPNSGYLVRNGSGPKPGGQDNNQLEVKIYRSYSNLADMKHASGPGFVPEPLDMSTVKVYRRSTASSSTLQPNGRAASLPRGFGRSRSLASTPNSSTMGPELRQNPPSRGMVHSQTLPHSTNLTSRGPSMRHSTSSTLSYQSSSAGYRVTKEDFPNAATIRKKLKQFEKCFLSSFFDRFSRLPSDTQLKSIAVALWPDDFPYTDQDGQLGAPSTRAISLFEYMRGDHGLPANIHEDGRFIMLVPPALFPGIVHVRESRGHAPIDANVLDDWSSLSRDVLMCVVAEAAAELSRIYEYQVSLLASDMSIQLVADHCAERSLSYLVPDPLSPFVACLDRNTVVHGAIRGGQGRRGGAVLRSNSVTHQSPTEPPKFISIIIGIKELKWNVYEIFSRAGLRRDVMLVRDDVPSLDEDDRCPWTYHVAPPTPRGGPGSDHMTYGYRGQIIDWDFADGVYHLNNTDEKRFSEESEWRYDDFHRLFVPLRQVVGARAMMKYCVDQARLSGMGTDRAGVKLDQYVREKVEGSEYTRDSIQVVYRPLERFVIPTGSASINLTGVEMPPRTVTLPSPPPSANYNNNNSNDVSVGNHGSGFYGNVVEETNVNDTLERPRNRSSRDPGDGKSRASYTSPTQGHALSPPQRDSYGIRNGPYGHPDQGGYPGDRISSGDVFVEDSRYENSENSAVERPRYMVRSDI